MTVQTAAPPRTFSSLFDAITSNVAAVLIGKKQAIELAVICLLADGHLLIEDVPGVGKTSLAKALAGSIECTWKRVQFTPDMLPGDLIGVSILQRSTDSFVFQPGPIFANIVLADEINRASPKTQSALLEAMEERQVSADGVSRALPDPFLVAATQNPVEHEGTYSLPEAQLDRFLLKLLIDVPERTDEVAVLRRHADGFTPRDLAALSAVVDAAGIRAAQEEAASVTVSDDVLGYVVDLARATRESPSVQLGASPRAATALLATAKAWAWLGGYPAITPDHVQTMLVPTWRHRLRLRPEAEIEGVSVDAILASVLRQTRVPI